MMGVVSVLVAMVQVRAARVLPPSTVHGCPLTVTEMVLMGKLAVVGSLKARERVLPDELREVISV
jgi:hypothetical protein